MKITIAGKEQELNFGFAFIHETNEKWNTERDGMRVNLGALYTNTALDMGDVESLADIVYFATANNDNRPGKKDVMTYMENLTIKEMESLFKDVKKGVNESVPVKFAMKKLNEMAKTSQKQMK